MITICFKLWQPHALKLGLEALVKNKYNSAQFILDWRVFFMNKKTRKIITAVIAVLLVLAMVVPLLSYAL